LTVFEQQFKILEKELDHINDISARMDGITQTTKNWAVATWAGSIALCIGKPVIWPFICMTGLLPIMFLYIDAHWRLLQSRSMFRVNKIREFLNDERLSKSIENNKFIDFIVYDPAAKTYKDDENYKFYVRYRKVINFPEVGYFYIPMSLLSIVIHFLLYLK
jgi:hypothetical protein